MVSTLFEILMIRFEVQHPDGGRRAVEVPEEISLSLMEVLRASEYSIEATCGGMALCATCHVEVLESGELPEMNDDEAYMLETLPHATATSRLACQLRVSPEMDGLVVRLKPEA